MERVFQSKYKFLTENCHLSSNNFKLKIQVTAFAQKFKVQLELKNASRIDLPLPTPFLHSFTDTSKACVRVSFCMTFDKSPRCHGRHS